MKPLYWTRILAAPEVTDGAEVKTAIWKEIVELPVDNLNEFTELFSRQAPIRKPTIRKREEKEKVEAAKLLDNKRSQNVGILAQSLRVDIQEIENAIYNFDTSVVNLESLQQIYEVVSNEIGLIICFKQPNRWKMLYLTLVFDQLLAYLVKINNLNFLLRRWYINHQSSHALW